MKPSLPRIIIKKFILRYRMTPPESPRDRAVDAGDNSDQKQGEQ